MERQNIELNERGYLVIDDAVSPEEINKAHEICMQYWYTYFTNRDMKQKDIELDFKNKSKTNPYFPSKRGTPMYKAMYGNVSKAGKEYMNTRKPANSQSCGMGRATSQPEVYHDTALNQIRENIRPIFNALYGSPTCMQLERFGLKLPVKSSKDMVCHTDMSYMEKYQTERPPRRKLTDPVSYAPYSDDGVPQRLQAVLCLSDSDAGWYGYEGAHHKYKEIGEMLEWPGVTKSIQKIDSDIMDKLGLRRIDIPSKRGRLIIWNCGIPHGNTKVKNTTPRLALYVNFQPYEKDCMAPKVIGLGNNLKEKK